MKTQVLLASLALPLLAIAGDQKPLGHPLDFVDRIFKDHDEKPEIPPEHFLSMLEANKLCGNQSTVTLEAPGMGCLMFYDGRVYVRNSSDDGLNVPLEWTLATLKDDPEHFTVYSTDPFGKKYYLYANGSHLTVTPTEDYVGRYSVRYTSSRLALPSLRRNVKHVIAGVKRYGCIPEASRIGSYMYYLGKRTLIYFNTTQTSRIQVVDIVPGGISFEIDSLERVFVFRPFSRLTFDHSGLWSTPTYEMWTFTKVVLPKQR